MPRDGVEPSGIHHQLGDELHGSRKSGRYTRFHVTICRCLRPEGFIYEARSETMSVLDPGCGKVGRILPGAWIERREGSERGDIRYLVKCFVNVFDMSSVGKWKVDD